MIIKNGCELKVMSEITIEKIINSDTTKILSAAIKALRVEILPQLNDESRIQLDQITRLLRHVLSRLSLREEGLRNLLEAASTFLDLDIPGMGELTVAQLETQCQRIEQTLSERLPGILAEAQNSKQGIEKLEQLIDIERAYFLSQDPDISQGSQVVYRGGRIDNAQMETADKQFREMDEETLTHYLSEKFPGAGIKAVNVRVIPGGFSKYTLFFSQVQETGNSVRELVIRMDMPIPYVNRTVADEFDLLKALHDQGFPVAKPLWLEADKTLFGGSFIVSERVQGTSDVAQWSADPLRARSACAELAKILARLHNFKPEQLARPSQLASLSAGQLMKQEIDKWFQRFEDRKSGPVPLQELPLIWLKENIPAALFERPARVVHGDVGFHNLMVDEEGRITALLDWEFSVLGDPTQDLCFVRGFVEGLMPWHDFMDVYLGEGGVPPCEEAAFFFNLWSKVRNSIGCVDVQAIFDTVMPDEVKFALAGYVFAPYLYIDECESLIKHLKQHLQ